MPSPIVKAIYLLREHIAIKNYPDKDVIFNKAEIKISFYVVVGTIMINGRRRDRNPVICVTSEKCV